ncbi:MAG: 30S ribosomal protein S9 [Candidatus Buchananbacteria bacterium]|nr:30S ribosomal protein S9 [Candidatus Buchananbacteria bacterium]
MPEKASQAKTKKNKTKEIKSKNKYTYAVGRRKSAVAQIRLFEKGKGDITINKKTAKEYLPDYNLQEIIYAPLKLVDLDKKIDVSVLIRGGGKKGQAEAIRHGIARALDKLNQDLHKTLKIAGYLTRDARVKERKKPGLKRARRAPQWAKR